MGRETILAPDIARLRAAAAQTAALLRGAQQTMAHAGDALASARQQQPSHDAGAARGEAALL
jgi:hypothetical protein